MITLFYKECPYIFHIIKKKQHTSSVMYNQTLIVLVNFHSSDLMYFFREIPINEIRTTDNQDVNIST